MGVHKRLTLAESENHERIEKPAALIAGKIKTKRVYSTVFHVNTNLKEFIVD